MLADPTLIIPSPPAIETSVDRKIVDRNEGEHYHSGHTKEHHSHAQSMTRNELPKILAGFYPVSTDGLIKAENF